MLNVDERILMDLDANEYFLLSHIAKYMNANSFAFPKNETLCLATRWSLNRLQRVKSALIEKGIIETVCRYREKSGGQTSNGYRIVTDAISVYINLKGKGDQRLPQNGVTGLPQNGVTGLPQNGVGILSIKVNKVLGLTEEKEERPINTPYEKEISAKKHIELLNSLSEKNKERFAALDDQKRNLFFDWLNYRTEIRDNYRTERGMSTPLRILSENTYDDAKYIFDYSLNNEYTGLFPEQLKKRNSKQHTNAKSNEERFGAATHAEIEKALAIRRARREAV